MNTSIEFLLPEFEGLVLQKTFVGPKRILLSVKSSVPLAVCPICNTPSNRVHSYYTRSLKDLPWADFTVQLTIRVRRFFCSNTQCHRTTFAERFGDVIAVYSRRTNRLNAKLRELALARGGEGGAQLAAKLGIKISADTLLRVVKKTPLKTSPTPRVLGVDDWAWKKSESYGTILVDLERHQPIDLLPDRKEATFASWLTAHPGVEIISRDRAGSYALAGRRGAPNAIQVADRFHVLKNLGETVERVVQRNYSQIKQVLVAPLAQSELLTATQTLPALPLKWHAAQKQARFEHRLALYSQVHSLQQAGYNQTEIAEELEISRRRVRVLLKGPPQIKQVVRPSKIEPYKAYLRQRFFEEGCHNAMQLWREVSEQGYDGSRSWLIDYITQLRQQLVEPDVQRTGGLPTTQPKALSDFLYSPRQITRWFIKELSEIRPRQQAKVEELCHKVAELAVTYKLTQEFRAIFRERQAAKLSEWINKSEQCGVREIVSFARGIKRDEAAVQAGISLRWSNGAVEGEVNKLKLLKREMYGRAKFELLKVRVLAG